MTTGPDDQGGRPDPHVLLGAFVLGGLSDEDHRTFTEHLRTCGPCQREVGQLSGIPRLLDLVGPDELPEPEPSRVADLLTALGRERRRQRVRLGVAASVLAALCLTAGAVLGPRLGQPAEPPTQRYAAVAASGSRAQVELAIVTRGWGTQLDLDCSELPGGGVLSLWLVDAQGAASVVATWNATASGRAALTAASAIRPAQIRAVEVRTASGQAVASVRT